jgi:class 3 adenylate cyclase
MVTIPTRTVTFLFTDIEGSTQLVNRFGDRYPEILSEHQKILRGTFATHNGYEVSTEGDSFFVTFARAADAIATAVSAQKELTVAWTGREGQQRAGCRSESIVNQVSTKGQHAVFASVI